MASLVASMGAASRQDATNLNTTTSQDLCIACHSVSFALKTDKIARILLHIILAS